MKKYLLIIAKYSGLFFLARALTAKKIRVLAYHGIWVGEGHYGNFLYMSADRFANRMALLKKWGYPVITFSEQFEAIEGTLRCPTMITIDDGWHGTWSAMLPALEEHGFPATVYLTTYYCLNQAPVIDVALGYCLSAVDINAGKTFHLPAFDMDPVTIDSEITRGKVLAQVKELSASLANDEARQRLLKSVCEQTNVNHNEMTRGRWFHLMNPMEVRDAARRGIKFEAHTHCHRTAHMGEDCLAEEISANIDCIRELTGETPRHFCYPSGVYSENMWPVLRSCDIASATTTEIGLVDDKTNPYAIPRILDGQYVTEIEFEAEMCGFSELTRVVRRLVKRKQ